MNADSRTNEELDRIIAEWMGWRFIENWHGPTKSFSGSMGLGEAWTDPKGKTSFEITPPSFCTDLNAIHKAETKLNSSQKVELWNTLFKVEMVGDVLEHGFRILNATARQRAEALVKIIESNKNE